MIEREKISEIIRLQQIVLNHYHETRTAREDDEVQPIREKLKELRKEVFGDKGRGETIVYKR
jgi:hypothetical protein